MLATIQINPGLVFAGGILIGWFFISFIGVCASVFRVLYTIHRD